MNISVMASKILQLAATDYIQLTVYHNAGVAKNIEDLASQSYMSIHRLS